MPQFQSPARRTSVRLHLRLCMLARHVPLSKNTTHAHEPCASMASPGARQTPSFSCLPRLMDINAKPLLEPSRAITPAPPCLTNTKAIHFHFHSPCLHAKRGDFRPRAHRLQRAAGTHVNDERPWKVEGPKDSIAFESRYRYLPAGQRSDTITVCECTRGMRPPSCPSVCPAHAKSSYPLRARRLHRAAGTRLSDDRPWKVELSKDCIAFLLRYRYLPAGRLSDFITACACPRGIRPRPVPLHTPMICVHPPHRHLLVSPFPFSLLPSLLLHLASAIPKLYNHYTPTTSTSFCIPFPSLARPPRNPSLLPALQY